MTARTIALVGLRCSGKSSVGRVLARRLGLPFVDLDDALAELAQERERATRSQERAGRAALGAGEWLARLGEPLFRELESAALARVLAAGEPCVLATGGGVVERPENRALLARSTCVWLRVDARELGRRMAADPTPRPGLTGEDPLAEIEILERRRAPLYAALARFEVDGRPPAAAVASEIERRLGRDEGSRRGQEKP